VIGFLTIFVLLFAYSSKVFSRKWPESDLVQKFYEQPKDSIDVLFLGASGFGTGVSPLILWKEAGFTSYVRSIGAQQAVMTYYYLLESLKYQHPKVVVLDAYRLIRHSDIENRESAYRRSYEPLKMSLIKWQFLFDITKNSDFDTFLSFLFPFFRYHTRWDELNRADFQFRKKINNIYRGQFLAVDVYPTELPENFMAPTEEEVNIHEDELYYFEEMIKICKENDIQVFFLVMPRLTLAKYSEYNAVKKFADENHILFVDYNFPDLMAEVGFDPQKDMFDPGHVNICGAKKFSINLSTYLLENFDLPDKRNDPNYQYWNSDLDKLEVLLAEHCQ
jgi:hypothetical protein